MLCGVTDLRRSRFTLVQCVPNLQHLGWQSDVLTTMVYYKGINHILIRQQIFKSCFYDIAEIRLKVAFFVG